MRGPLSARHAQRWSRLHHGIDPDAVPALRPWLAVMWTLARPLVRLRVPPTAITVLGVVLAVDAVLLARSRPWWALAAVLLAAVCDSVDGAIAVVADRATPWGARADAVADRLVDVAFALVLWRCGLSWWIGGVAAVLAVAVDLLRRVLRRPATITVAERPSWTICAGLACASSAVTGAVWPVEVCASVWLALGVLGLAQLVRRPRVLAL